MAIDAIKILGDLLSSGNLSNGSGNNALGNILNSVLNGQGNQNGRVADSLGGLQNNNQSYDRQQPGGGLGDILNQVLGGSNSNTGNSGGLGDILGGLLGSNGKQTAQNYDNNSAGGLSDLLGGLMSGGQAGSLSDLLGAALGQKAQQANPNMPNPQPNQSSHLPQGVDAELANRQAELVLKAMINAAKSDGNVNDAEKEKIIGKLGDVTQEEADFVRREFNAPLDANALANEVPSGMQQQIYAVSLTAIDLDTNEEAQYLHKLAQALNINAQQANQIHDQLGVRKIYA